MGMMIAALSLLSLWLLPFSSSAASKKPICGGGVTILSDHSARVFKVSRPAPAERHDSLIMACARDSEPKLLGSPTTTSYNGKFLAAVDTKSLALRPPWVGYAQTNSGVDTWTMTVAARNLRTGATTYCSVGGARAPEPGPAVTGIALTSNGSLAWIGEGNQNPSSILEPLVRRVAECGTNGTVTVLDEGEGIDLQSLQLQHSALQWMDSGSLRTAVLP